MKITQAELKVLIKQCVSNSGVYTIQDFLKYAHDNSDKGVTRNEIYRALSSLIKTNDIVRIEQGAYAKDFNFKCVKNNTSIINEKGIKIKKDLIDYLDKMYAEFEDLIACVNIMDLSDEIYEIIIKICELKKTINSIKQECQK